MTMANSEIRRITVPVGSTIRATRQDGTQSIYVFEGTEPQGDIFVDGSGQRHRDVGEYTKLERKTDDGWMPV